MWINNVKLHFSVYLLEACECLRGFSSPALFTLIPSRVILVNEKNCWNASSNSSNTIGMLLVSLSNYENFTKDMPLCFNHLQKLCHLFSIRHQRHIVAFSSLINYNWCVFSTDVQKTWFHIVYPLAFLINAS